MADLDLPRLSICIPTYNFGDFIGATLQSVLHQIEPSVEVVVLDSGSTDQTASIIQALARVHSCLRYEVTERPCGIDRDLDRVVRMARGKYCWLFSADDLMASGAIRSVLAELEDAHDLYLCMHTDETISMSVLCERHPVLALSHAASFQLADTLTSARYFGLALTTEAFFSFMSSLIVRKSAWVAAPLDPQFIGTCWAHVARFFGLMQTGLRVRFLATVLVRRRGENDSFATHGVVRRYALAIQGFIRLATHFWGADSDQTSHIKRVLRTEFSWIAFWRGKAACMRNPSLEDKLLLDQLMASIYSGSKPACLATRWAYRLLPGTLYEPVRKLGFGRPVKPN